MAETHPPKAAVIGHPISHSLSPDIFAVFSKKLNLPILYEKINVKPDSLGDFVTKNKTKYIGWNVTIPHKTSIIQYVDELTPEANKIGAANVVHNTEGKTTGHNTDVFGMKKSLEEQGIALKNNAAVLYGAGGASRAVAYVLGELGLKHVFVTDLNSKFSAQLCRDFTALFPSTSFEPENDIKAVGTAVSIIINATPIGLPGVQGDLKFPHLFASKALAFDMNYVSQNSSFMSQAKEQGLMVANGLDMLIWQAIRTWEIWIGPVKNPMPLKEKAKKALLQKLSETGAK